MAAAAAGGARQRAQRPLRNFIKESLQRNAPRAPVEPLGKWHIARGDLVEVLGGKDKGKQGKVVSVLRKKNRVIVEGVNMVNKTVRGQGPEQPGGLFKVEASIHYSKVNLVDPTSGRATRVATRYLEDGTKVRVAKKSGTIIPRPETLKVRRVPRPTEPGPSDTPTELVQKETWPGLEFEYQRLLARRAALAAENAARREAAHRPDALADVPFTTRKRMPFAGMVADSAVATAER